MENPDQTLAVEFFIKPIENPRKSREAGRPIFDDREYVRIRFPADNKRELVAPAHEEHFNNGASTTYAQRFEGSYQAFKNNDINFISGTPLESMPGLSASQRSELTALNIRTVEQLANLPTQAKKRLGMNGQGLVTMASEFLEASKETADVAALRAELAQLRAQVAGAAPATVADPYEGFEVEDLKNMIKDAGGEIPRGNATRETLIARLEEIRADKVAA